MVAMYAGLNLLNLTLRRKKKNFGGILIKYNNFHAFYYTVAIMASMCPRLIAERSSVQF